MTRSYLYVPGDDEAKLAKAGARGADALICDLEDSVTPSRKQVARDLVSSAAGALAATRVEVWVRVNARFLERDLAAVLQPCLTGIFVPKAEPALLAEAAQILDGDPAWRHVKLIALVETAQGVLDLPAIARMPRVARLSIGEADLTASLGIRPSAAEPELWGIRSQMVIASAAAGLPGPIGPVHLTVKDLDGLRSSTVELQRWGFRARAAIHPGQVAGINEVFTPSAREVAEALAVASAFESALASGSGVHLDADGQMVDLAVVRSAVDTLARAGLTPPAAIDDLVRRA
ncbi:HpcH/HpaI aldolase/citrate lyase family protein [Solwaraspora sp. WMMB335]|uniref:HpcH/HpaI aldolase/citrate lyase family protein n=1 Tax=Solwaraspora sp. WMMB335 TaxID=3404118 RepID=UPI003B954A05